MLTADKFKRVAIQKKKQSVLTAQLFLTGRMHGDD